MASSPTFLHQFHCQLENVFYLRHEKQSINYYENYQDPTFFHALWNVDSHADSKLQ